MKDTIKLLIENKLTANQYIALYLLYKQEYVVMADYRDIMEIYSLSLLTDKEKENLLHREYIKPTDETGRYDITNKAAEMFFIEDREPAYEIWNIYPTMYSRDGDHFPLKLNISHTIFKKLYESIIGDDITEHDSILKDIEFGIENDMINMRMDKFFTGEIYKEIRKVRMAKENTNKISQHLNKRNEF